MNISAPFIKRPVGTSLLTIALALAGCLGFLLLPVSPLPQVDYPTIQVSANLPGASPETMASSVATPLERQLGHIAGITQMTSTNNLGSTNITLQFDLNRDINGAARDVQAAINASRSQLPANLPNNPFYRKVNPSDAPVLLMALTSDTIEVKDLYDVASSVLQQKIAQEKGVGQVFVGGSSLPAVRVELNPDAANKYGISLDQVRAVLNSANANRPKGRLEDEGTTWEIHATDQLLKADQYRPLIVAYRNNSPVQLADIADVRDSVEDLRGGGLANGKPAILIIVFRQPGANIIETVDRVKALIPQLRASISPAINLAVINDRTTTIRASVKDVEITLLISISLVILVVFAFLRNAWATVIPSVAVPLSLLGTFGAMYLLGYSLDNLSLMALTISTGFVVDDAIVVIENITRCLEQGMRPLKAAMLGARQIGFTVLSMSISLIAVFIPILLMGGIVGRLFREFAVTLSIAIAVSLLVSLTATPMMCAKFLKPESERRHGRIYRFSEKVFNLFHSEYEIALGWVLRHPGLMLVVTIATICFNIYLYIIVPKGFFPDQDTGRLQASVQASQDISFQAMRQKLTESVSIIMTDPAIDTVGAFTGGGGGSTTNTGRMFISLKPLEERKVSTTDVIARLRGKLSRLAGASTFLRPVQDINVGGRLGGGLYQYTLQDDNLDELTTWAPRLLAKLRTVPHLTDLSTDQQDRGLQEKLVIDRDTAARLGISAQMIDDALYDAFGQRPVSTMYTQLNQYHVVMEVAPRYWQSPDTLKQIYVRSTGIQQTPSPTAQSASAGGGGVTTSPPTLAAAASQPTSLSAFAPTPNNFVIAPRTNGFVTAQTTNGFVTATFNTPTTGASPAQIDTTTLAAGAAAGSTTQATTTTSVTPATNPVAPTSPTSPPTPGATPASGATPSTGGSTSSSTGTTPSATTPSQSTSTGGSTATGSQPATSTTAPTTRVAPEPPAATSSATSGTSQASTTASSTTPAATGTAPASTASNSGSTIGASTAGGGQTTSTSPSGAPASGPATASELSPSSGPTGLAVPAPASTAGGGSPSTVAGGPQTPTPALVPAGAEVPLSAFAHFERTTTTLSVNHQGQFPAVTISFNLAPGVALGDAVNAIDAAQREIGMPSTIQSGFQGTAQAFQASLANEPILILAALVAVYIVLGILYESLIHPLTILSTLPSAGVGAILALLLCQTELSVIALIGIILLIGIVKKNAIMMIDFALEAERTEGRDPKSAIYEACLLRFRPIMMTTMAALLGGLPLAIGLGVGSELRRPLGITIVGGLIVSQMLTLFTTPVIYLYLDRVRLRFKLKRRAELSTEY